MHDLDSIVLCVWNLFDYYWFGMLVDIVIAWLIVVKLEKCETSKIKEWTIIPYQKGKLHYHLKSYYFHYT